MVALDNLCIKRICYVMLCYVMLMQYKANDRYHLGHSGISKEVTYSTDF